MLALALFSVYWDRNNCRTGGVATRKSKGRWQLASSCPVTLEMSDTQSKGKNTMTIVPLASQQPGDSSAQPVNTEVHVEDMQSAVFGVLRAVENSVNNKINLVVDPPPETPDLSCEQISISYQYRLFFNTPWFPQISSTTTFGITQKMIPVLPGHLPTFCLKIYST